MRVRRRLGSAQSRNLINTVALVDLPPTPLSPSESLSSKEEACLIVLKIEFKPGPT